MRKIYLENLPKIKTKNRQMINWKESVGILVKFEYDYNEGYIEILEYYRVKNNFKLKIKYDEKVIDIDTSHFKNAKSFVF